MVLNFIFQMWAIWIQVICRHLCEPTAASSATVPSGIRTICSTWCCKSSFVAWCRRLCCAWPRCDTVWWAHRPIQCRTADNRTASWLLSLRWRRHNVIGWCARAVEGDEEWVSLSRKQMCNESRTFARNSGILSSGTGSKSSSTMSWARALHSFFFFRARIIWAWLEWEWQIVQFNSHASSVRNQPQFRRATSFRTFRFRLTQLWLRCRLHPISLRNIPLSFNISVFAFSSNSRPFSQKTLKFRQNL